MKKNTGVRSQKSEGKSPKLNPCPVCGEKVKIVKVEKPEHENVKAMSGTWYRIACVKLLKKRFSQE